jgi:hypothetical protein
MVRRDGTEALLVICFDDIAGERSVLFGGFCFLLTCITGGIG